MCESKTCQKLPCQDEETQEVCVGRYPNARQEPSVCSDSGHEGETDRPRESSNSMKMGKGSHDRCEEKRIGLTLLN
jgi:hypothetical protein